jgi:hypothetical protein
MKKLIVIISTLALFAQCKKKEEEPFILPVLSTCLSSHTTEVVDKDSVFENLYNCQAVEETTIGHYNYHYPFFNPNSNDEIGFIREDYLAKGTDKYQLCIFNFCTSKVKVVAPCKLAPPDWGKIGKIAFTNPQSKLTTYEPQADKLTLLDNITLSGSPIWHSKGDSLMFSMKDILYISDGKGKTTDTLGTGYVNWGWVNDSIINVVKVKPNINALYIGIMNRYLKEFYSNESIPTELVKFMKFIPSSVEYSIAQNGSPVPTNKDINAQLFEKDNRKYPYFSYNSENKFLVVQKADRIRVSQCKLLVKNSISIYQLNTGEKALKIPE